MKHVCAWFSKDKGLANTVTSGILQAHVLVGNSEELLIGIFGEIEAIVTTVGLCAGHESNDQASYDYLRETRSALTAMYIEVVKMAPTLVQHVPDRVTKAVLQRLSSSNCVNPYVASTCVLASEWTHWNRRPCLLEWLGRIVA